MFQFAAVVCLIAVAASNPVKQAAPVRWRFKETIYGPGSSVDGDRNSVPKPRMWPEAHTPYTYDEGLSAACVEAFEFLIGTEINLKTCFEFERIDSTWNDYIIYIQHGDGFSAHIGYNKDAKKHIVTVPNNDTFCELKAPLLHLLLHVIGFYDEHVRIDRDDYITIHWENIHSNSYGSFQKLDDKKAVTYDGFDFDTAMLLDQTYDSKSEDLNSWTPKDSSVTITPFVDKKTLSKSDIYRIKTMYGCI